MDLFWVDHLEMMEYLRGSVNLRAYGQREPLVEYKKDGLRFFRDMEVSIARQIADIFSSVIDFHSDLQKGDKVVTGGGLNATVKRLAGNEEVILDLGNGVEVTAQRYSIMMVRDSQAKSDKKEDKKDDKK